MEIKNFINGELQSNHFNDSQDVFGVVINCAFPFPDSFQRNYLNFFNQISCPELWVMKPESLHVTVSTVVAFQNFFNISPEQKALFNYLVEALTFEVDKYFLANPFNSFYLYPQSIGLSNAATFIEWREENSVITQFRAALETIYKEKIFSDILKDVGVKNPDIIHSTILRYNSLTTEKLLLDKLKSVKPEFSKILINEFSINTEIRPFMSKTVCKQKWTCSQNQLSARI